MSRPQRLRDASVQSHIVEKSERMKANCKERIAAARKLKGA